MPCASPKIPHWNWCSGLTRIGLELKDFSKPCSKKPDRHSSGFINVTIIFIRSRSAYTLLPCKLCPSSTTRLQSARGFFACIGERIISSESKKVKMYCRDGPFSESVLDNANRSCAALCISWLVLANAGVCKLWLVTFPHNGLGGSYFDNVSLQVQMFKVGRQRVAPRLFCTYHRHLPRHENYNWNALQRWLSIASLDSKIDFF